MVLENHDDGNMSNTSQKRCIASTFILRAEHRASLWYALCTWAGRIILGTHGTWLYADALMHGLLRDQVDNLVAFLPRCDGLAGSARRLPGTNYADDHAHSIASPTGGRASRCVRLRRREGVKKKTPICMWDVQRSRPGKCCGHTSGRTTQRCTPRTRSRARLPFRVCLAARGEQIYSKPSR